MSFLDTMREMIGPGEGFRGGRCPKCREAVLVTKHEGLMRLQCENCVWSVWECETCEGSGFEGYDSKCRDCFTTGVRQPRNCPTCGSPSPTMHPSKDGTSKGEPVRCPDEWHGDPEAFLLRTEHETR